MALVAAPHRFFPVFILPSGIAGRNSKLETKVFRHVVQFRICSQSGRVKTFAGKNDFVLADRLIHHSLAQALVQSPAKFKRYNHLDMADLETLLQKNHKKYDTVFVVTESVFSMNGDYPDLKTLVALKKKFPFILLLDEAHATGVFGEHGGGLAEEMNVLDEVDIIVGTLVKHWPAWVPMY